jgi:hypothetical protein
MLDKRKVISLYMSKSRVLKAFFIFQQEERAGYALRGVGLFPL